jgi:hypothetical protein
MTTSAHRFDPGAIIEGFRTSRIWSPRFALRRTERLAQLAPHNDPLPRAPGIYRVHLERSPVLAYIGQTGDLRRRINELSVGVYADAMPFTTPHVAAPCLWAWRQIPPRAPFTVSFVSVSDDVSAFWRQGLEDVALSIDRWDRKRLPVQEPAWRMCYSPLANFGKAPVGWQLSSSRESGRQGGPTATQEEAHEPSIMPRGDLDDPQDACAEVWGGYSWSSWQGAREVKMPPEARGLYRLWERDAPDLLFLGYGCLAGAASHAARTNVRLLFSAVAGPWATHALQELRTDLVGLYVCQRKALPVAQYGGSANRHAGNPWPQEVGQ